MFKKFFIISLLFFIIFILWTFLLLFINVKPVGPNNSFIGFANINIYVHTLLGTNLFLYYLTDWLSIIPVFIMFGFAILGFIQLLKRKSFFKVDFDIYLLGVFYLLLFFIYLFFENFIINFRPILIEGFLEASYPSSTTLLVVTIIGLTIIQNNLKNKNVVLKKFLNFLLYVFMFFMVICRFISGVHWFTDILGGLFLSISLISLYYYLIKKHL